MRRSFWIKGPTLILAVAALFYFEGLTAIGVAATIIAAGSGLLFAVVMHPNASVWTRTLSRAPSTTDAVALTFDDGPNPNATVEIAEILEARGIKAAFFVVGERVRAHPEILTRLHDRGHLVCNHTDTHSMSFHFRLWNTFRTELQKCNDAIAGIIGLQPTLFRSPQGAKNPALGDVLNEMKMTAIGWQVRGLDAVRGNKRAIEERILAGARPGGVIMLHDGTGFGGRSDASPTVEALPRIIDGLQARGLRFVRLDELLEVEPYRRVPQQ